MGVPSVARTSAPQYESTAVRPALFAARGSIVASVMTTDACVSATIEQYVSHSGLSAPRCDRCCSRSKSATFRSTAPSSLYRPVKRCCVWVLRYSRTLPTPLLRSRSISSSRTGSLESSNRARAGEGPATGALEAACSAGIPSDLRIVAGMAARGIVSTNVDPEPHSLSTVSSARIPLARSRLIARPSPVPWAVRLKSPSTCMKGWKIASSFSGGMPMPESATRMRTIWSSTSQLMRTRPGGGVNFTALDRRFTSTCFRRSSSAWTARSAGHWSTSRVRPLETAWVAIIPATSRKVAASDTGTML